jgi:signal transduction histidine kinase
MSHELRTPLNAVIGYSQILLEDAESEGDSASVTDLTKIHVAGQHLLKLVNEVLDLSKIEAGKMELNLEEIDLTALLQEIAEGTRPAVMNNGNQFVCSISPHLGTALCDAGKFKNMAAQLLDNATKFTQNGKVELTASREADDRGDYLVVAVIDTGIGIAPDKITNLFEKFTVADDSSTSKYGGTGLGLALSQKLCKLMGGEVFVESEFGKGSRFTIRLPLAAGRRRTDLHGAATLAPAVLSFTPQSAAEMPHA